MQGRRGTLRAELPVPSRPDRALLLPSGPIWRASSARAASCAPSPWRCATRRSGTMARWSATNVFLGKPGKAGPLRGGARADQRGRDGRVRGQEAGVDGHSGGRAGQSARHPGRDSRAALPRSRAGRLRHLPALPAHRQKTPKRATCCCCSGSTRPDKIELEKALAALDRGLLVPR